MPEFKQIAVIGAGTMGSGIAAQIANAGNKVLLMDLPRDDDPIGVLIDAKKRLLKSDPPAHKLPLSPYLTFFGENMANHIFPRATCLASSSVTSCLVYENTIATQLILEFQKFRACTFTFWLVMLSTKQ